MIVFPNAKINLGLEVLGKRPDGFHDLQSLFLPVPWRDALEVVEDRKGDKGSFSFASSGLEIPGNPEGNLVVKAYQILHKRFQLPAVHIHLHKVIPMGAGLGGGSADGAFMIKVLVELFDLPLSVAEQEEIAAELGSDCPFFIRNTPQLVTGRGERLAPIDFSYKDHWVSIVWPGIHVSTKAAFAGIAPRKAASDWSNVHAFNDVSASNFKNDFEPQVFEAYPALQSLQKQMYDAGAEYASMTGTGSAVYGIFKSKPKQSLLSAGAIGFLTSF